LEDEVTHSSQNPNMLTSKPEAELGDVAADCLTKPLKKTQLKASLEMLGLKGEQELRVELGCCEYDAFRLLFVVNGSRYGLPRSAQRCLLLPSGKHICLAWQSCIYCSRSQHP
jgi:hypothetical protein